LCFCGNNNLSLVTLPVEYDASHRALTVRDKKMLTQQNMKGPRCSDMGCEVTAFSYFIVLCFHLWEAAAEEIRQLEKGLIISSVWMEEASRFE
jgi:hypothetical protein